MVYEYRLAFSTISKATLEGSPSYLIENFPVQSDQVNDTPWTPPIDNGTLYPHLARYTQTADLTQRGDGYWLFNWVLPYLTEGMVGHLENGPLYACNWCGALWAAVTVKTLCKDGVFRVYNAYALVPVEEGSHFRRGYLGVEDYLIRFVHGVYLP